MKNSFNGIIKSKRFLVIAAAAVVVMLALGWYHQRATHAVPKIPVVSYSTTTPSEDKPGKGYTWRGGLNDPKVIRLPTIRTEGFIQNVGVDQNKQVAVPNNIHFAGWFSNSVRPGQLGLSLIDGHVDGRVGAGIFKNLAGLKAGDKYTVEMGDGSIKQYQVKNVVTVDTKDAANILFSQDPRIKNQLNLITCGGNFSTQSGQYNKRVIVASELIKG
jgi:sortase A